MWSTLLPLNGANTAVSIIWTKPPRSHYMILSYGWWGQFWLCVCRFDPDRFSADRMQQLPPYAFEPFGFAGKRTCLGRQFAMAAVSVLLAKLLRSGLRLCLAPDQTVTPKYDLTGKPEDEIWITVEHGDWHYHNIDIGITVTVNTHARLCAVNYVNFVTG